MTRSKTAADTPIRTCHICGKQGKIPTEFPTSRHELLKRTCHECRPRLTRTCTRCGKQGSIESGGFPRTGNICNDCHRWRDRANQQNLRARQEGKTGALTDTELATLYAKQGRRCYYCLDDLTGQISVDHYTPLSRGGTNTIDNIVLTCRTCNNAKNDMHPDAYLAWLHGVAKRLRP